MKLLIIIFLLISNVFAKEKYFNPFHDQKIRDLVFEVESKAIDTLLKNKFMKNKDVKLVLRVYWIKNNKMDGEFVGTLPSVKEEILSDIKDTMLEQIKNLMSSNISDAIKSYEKVDNKGKYKKYIDKAGISEIQEILVNESKKDSVSIILKRPTGTDKTQYFLGRFKWSDERPLIISLKREIYEGLQNTKINSSIKYSRFGQYWLPKQISTTTRQTLKISKIDQYETKRNFDEELLFMNYRVNQNEALRWFAKK
jgi:hypothetical protein